MADTSDRRHVGQLRYNWRSSFEQLEVNVVYSGGKYLQAWPPSGYSGSANDRDFPDFPFVADSWCWIKIYPAATPRERHAINLFRLLGLDAYRKMAEKK